MTNKQFALLWVSAAVLVVCSVLGASGLDEKPAEALGVRIQGPVDAIVGDLVVLQLVTEGPVESQVWSIEPPLPGFQPSGEVATFSNRHPGVYRVTASVGGARGQSAHTSHTFELFAAPADQVVSLEDLVAPPRPLDVAALVRQWVAEVASPNKAAEAAELAGTLRSTANLLATGQVNAAADPQRDLEQAAEVALGPEAFQRWATFFARVRTLIEPLNQAGVVSTPVQFAQTYNNLAELVERASAGP